MSIRFDAIVIGGGPAGAITALRLSRCGWHIALIERGERFRSKTCGHCLNPRAIAVLQRTGLLERVQAIAVGVTTAFRVHSPGRQPFESALGNTCVPDRLGGIVVARNRLDQLLIDSAAEGGVTVFQPAAARVVSMTGERSIIEVSQRHRHERLTAPLIVGADGVGSGVARAAGLSDARCAGRKFGFSFECTVPEDAAARHDTVDMFVMPNGYLGVVRQAERWHVGGLISTGGAAHGREPFAFVRSAAARHEPLRRAKFDRIIAADAADFHAVGPMPWRPRAISNSRAALVGDAAGYIEPFTGEGMSWAMQSADLLADVLGSAPPGAWNDQLANEYSLRWKRVIERQQHWCRRISAALEWPVAVEWLLRAGKAFPGISRRIVEQVVAA